MTTPTCRVTVGLGGTKFEPPRACGLPVVRWGLCEKHLEMRVRLGGAP